MTRPTPPSNDPPVAPPRRRAAAIASGSLLATAAAALMLWSWMPSCGGEPAPVPPTPLPGATRPLPTDRLLVVDGETFTFADLAAPLAVLDARYPEYNERIKIQKVLTQHSLPLRFAQREFAAQRQEQLALARTFRSASGNVEELQRNSARQAHSRNWLTAGDLDLPIAEFLFDPARTGAVSDPIEVPQGYVLAAAFELEQGREVIKDRCDALQVLFLTHPASLWSEWLTALRTRLEDKVTYVHPDYRQALPPWLKQP